MRSGPLTAAAVETVTAAAAAANMLQCENFYSRPSLSLCVCVQLPKSGIHFNYTAFEACRSLIRLKRLLPRNEGESRTEWMSGVRDKQLIAGRQVYQLETSG